MYINPLKSIKECKKECWKNHIHTNKLIKLENDQLIFILF